MQEPCTFFLQVHIPVMFFSSDCIVLFFAAFYPQLTYLLTSLVLVLLAPLVLLKGEGGVLLVDDVLSLQQHFSCSSLLHLTKSFANICMVLPSLVLVLLAPLVLIRASLLDADIFSQQHFCCLDVLLATLVLREKEVDVLLLDPAIFLQQHSICSDLHLTCPPAW